MTGTSMASPYVCGVAALMLAIAARPDRRTAPGHRAQHVAPARRATTSRWRNDTGFGVIDAAACVEEAGVASARSGMKLKVF